MLSARNCYQNGSAHTLFQAQDFHVLFYNVQGLISHLAELCAVIRLSTVLPSLVSLNETFLDESVEDVCLEGYELVARRDRQDGRKCGGVAVYAAKPLSGRIAMLERLFLA